MAAMCCSHLSKRWIAARSRQASVLGLIRLHELKQGQEQAVGSKLGFAGLDELPGRGHEASLDSRQVARAVVPKRRAERSQANPFGLAHSPNR